MTNWTDGFAETNGMTMHYTRTGGEKPPVVLCHGFSDGGECWTHLVRALEAEYDVYMIDARCHGQSSAPESGNNADAMAADLSGFIEALRLDRPVVAAARGAMDDATAFNPRVRLLWFGAGTGEPREWASRSAAWPN